MRLEELEGQETRQGSLAIDRRQRRHRCAADDGLQLAEVTTAGADLDPCSLGQHGQYTSALAGLGTHIEVRALGFDAIDPLAPESRTGQVWLGLVAGPVLQMHVEAVDGQHRHRCGRC
ncbi:hypothetical protein D9M68_686770 [compost metagenome]